MKVSAILKGIPDQFGRYPICIRINEGEKRTYYTTAYRATKDQFKKGLDESLSSKIRQIAIRIEMDLLESKKKYADAEFFGYASQCLKEWDKIRAYNTMRNYSVEVQKLKGFRSSFKLSEITPQFLTAYSQHLYSLDNIATTVWTSFKFMRMVILKAKRERLIEDNPFDIFKMPAYKDPPKIFLTKEEVQKIENYIADAGANKFCATWFVIGCYTGLRYSDMNAFDKNKNIRSGRLIVNTIKTKEVISMPLAEKVKMLLESINYQSMFISNQKYNAALKKIAEKLAMRSFTCHTSRHTFGTMCADAGISQEVTSKLMGHRTLKSTAIYYRINNPRIDKEIEKLF